MKTKTSHTPGPWEYIESFDDLDKRSFVVWELDSRTMGHFGSYQAAKEICKQEAECNARLIAGAPDLLEAAQGVMEAFDGYQDMTNGQAKARVAKLRAAIDKAEGK